MAKKAGMSTGVEVARISVKVSPDTKQFRRDLKSDLEAIEKSMKAHIDIEPDMKGFRRKVNAGTKGLKSKIEVEPDVNNLARLRQKMSKLLEMPSFGSGINFTGWATIFAGIMAVLAPVVGVISSALMALPGLIAAVATPIAALALGMDGLMAAASKLEQPFKNLRTVMSTAVEAQFAPVLEKLVGVFPTLTASLPKVTQGLADMLDGVVGVVTSAGGMARVENIIDNIAAALSKSAPGISSFTDGLLQLTDELSKKLPGMAGWFNQMGDRFAAWVEKISADGSLGKAFEGLGATVDTLVNSLAPLFQQGIDFMADPKKVAAFSGLLSGLGATLQGLVSLSSKLYDAIVWTAETAIIAYGKLRATIAGVVADGATAIVRIKDAISTAAATLTGVWNAVTAAASAAWNGVVATVQGAWNGIVSAVQTGVSAVIQAVSELPGKIKSFFADSATWLVEAGKNIVQGLINGLGSMIGAAAAKARELAGSVVSAVTSALGIKSPSRVFTEIGDFAAQGFGIGMEAGFQPVLEQAKALADELSQAFKDGTDMSGALGGISTDDLKRAMAVIEEEKKRLKVERDFIPRTDKSGRASLQNQLDQLQAQKDILAYQKERIHNESQYADVAGYGATADEAMSQMTNRMAAAVAAPVQQFAGDLGISGNGALSQLLTQVPNYVFNVLSVDDAMSIKDRERSKNAIGAVGRT